MYKELRRRGAVEVSPLTYHPDRSKVCGRMWGGEAKLALDGNTYWFKMWWHGPDEDPGFDRIEDQMRLGGITTSDGKYHDIYWSAYIIENPFQIWLHSTGWFGNRDLESKLPIRLNYNFELNKPTDASPELLTELGFTQVL